MQSVAIDFFHDNLRYSRLERETCERVLHARPEGTSLLTQEGWPILCFERPEGRFVLDVPLHHEMVERLGREPDCAVIVFGLGVGNAVRQLLSVGTRVLAVFEPEPGILRRFLENGPSDLSDIPIVTSEKELEMVWSRVVGDRSNIHLTDTPGYEAAFSETRSRLALRILSLLQSNVVNEQTYRARGRVWIKDIIENAAYISNVPSAHHLEGAFKDVPAFIVGAGPSLDKNIGLLKEASKKGLVIAVNSAGRALDQAGVNPQMIACLESIDVSHLISDLSYIDEVARIFALTAHPNVFDVGKGPLLTVFEQIPHVASQFEALFASSGLPVCGSVSTACFSLAYRMGCSPIVLLGQDLAYTDGRCYAQKTAYEASRVALSEDGESLRHDWCDTMLETHKRAGNELPEGQHLSEAVAWGGEGVVSSAVNFNQVRLWFERCAMLLKQGGGPRLVNATEGGARIEGFEECSLQELLGTLPEHDIKGRDIEEKARKGGVAITGEDVIALLSRNEKGAQVVGRLAERLAEASREMERRWDSPDAGGVSEHLRRLQTAELELKAAVHQFPWVDAWAWRDVDEALVALDDEMGLPETLQGLRKESRLGQAIASAATELERCLHLRQQELSGQTR